MTRMEPIAIIGMAGRFPGAGDLRDFWQNLRDGVESIARFSEDQLRRAGVDPALIRDPNYVPARGILDDVELFDAAFFGINPREAEVLDPQHRLFLESAWEALEDAGYDPDRQNCPAGVFAGTTMSTYLLSNLLANPELLRTVGAYQTMLGNDKDYLATRVVVQAQPPRTQRGGSDGVLHLAGRRSHGVRRPPDAPVRHGARGGCLDRGSPAHGLSVPAGHDPLSGRALPRLRRRGGRYGRRRGRGHRRPQASGGCAGRR